MGAHNVTLIHKLSSSAQTLIHTMSTFDRSGVNTRKGPVQKRNAPGPGSYGFVHIMNHVDENYTIGSGQIRKTVRRRKRNAGRKVSRRTRATKTVVVPARASVPKTRKYRKSVLKAAGIFPRK